MSTGETINSTTINIDFSAPKYIKLNVKQGDNGIRHFLFSFTNNGAPVNFDWGSIYALLKAKKPDGTYIAAECPLSEDGIVNLEISESITKVPGICTCEIALFQRSAVTDTSNISNEPAGNVIASMDFIINVYPSAVDNCEIESSDDFSALNDLMSKVLRDYQFILDESSGIITAIRTINGNSPDKSGNYTLQEEDFKIVIDLFNKSLNEGLGKKVPNERTVNGKALDKDININYEDVGADPAGAASSVVGGHNRDENSHQDIRNQISSLGSETIKSVNGLKPDETGGVALQARHIGALPASGGTMTGNIDLGGNALTNVKAPAAATDAATKGYVDERIVTHQNVSVPASAWHSGGTIGGAMRPIYADVTLSNVTSNMYVSVVFKQDDIEAYNFAATCYVNDGFIEIYAETAPTVAITIPTIICLKA